MTMMVMIIAPSSGPGHGWRMAAEEWGKKNSANDSPAKVSQCLSCTFRYVVRSVDLLVVNGQEWVEAYGGKVRATEKDRIRIPLDVALLWMLAGHKDVNEWIKYQQ